MNDLEKPAKAIPKFLVAGGVLFSIGACLYVYVENVPSSGVAMNGIGLGLLSLLGIVLAGIGVLTVCVSFVFRTKAQRKE